MKAVNPGWGAAAEDHSRHGQGPTIRASRGARLDDSGHMKGGVATRARQLSRQTVALRRAVLHPLAVSAGAGAWAQTGLCCALSPCDPTGPICCVMRPP